MESRLFCLHKSRSVQITALLLASALFPVVVQTSAQPQTSSPTQFVDVTASSGIKFTHFKGNKGVSINLEEFGPGVCVSDFNHAARRFYARSGYQQVGTLGDLLVAGSAELLLRKTIDASRLS